MKKLILIAFGIILFASAQAQQISLLTFGGYTFGSRFSYYGGEGYVGDGAQWGGGLEFGMGETGRAIELIYQGMSSSGYVNDYTTVIPQYKEGNVSVNYYMAGITQYAPLKDKLSAFGTIDLGACYASTNVSSATKFAWGLRGGLRVAASEKVSLRFHAQLMCPVQSMGLGIYAGTGGVSTGASTYSSVFQFNLGGSLNFRLK